MKNLQPDPNCAEIPRDDPESVSAAKNIIAGERSVGAFYTELETDAEKILRLKENLKEIKAFSIARRFLEYVVRSIELDTDARSRLKIYQQWALCTYKDNDLPADKRLNEALRILNDGEELDQSGAIPGNNFPYPYLITTRNQETLGLVGAIYKRKWEVDSQKGHLERSLLYYRRGYDLGPEKDQGYTGINAAFVLDLLAYQEEDEAEKSGSTSVTAAERRREAKKIRLDVIKKVSPLSDAAPTKWLAGEWWYYGTVAEAHFGLEQYEDAVKWLKDGKAKARRISEWEEESTINQLARLAIIQDPLRLSGREYKDTPAWKALHEVFDNHPAAVRSAFIGKIGLGLSGGGFRAALFHIGTLAKLAELDVLRNVEAISCVSGGSIIGAHYYLEVRRLLQTKPDSKITADDYKDIVKKIVDDFLAGVQRNVRMRIFAEFSTNLKMILFRLYSRTERAGDLYESEIFARVIDGEHTGKRWLSRLNIHPNEGPPDFAPKLHNWKRSAKAPILILNSATLNTGHNWQFTTTWMGEPPSSIDVEVDTNDHFRRMYYNEAPPDHNCVRLGHAVSASAGVPGIFEPLSLDKLYPERIVRLVDGGVCDNQGISSLLEQDCTVILVSDGSGQMVSQKIPSDGLLGVPLRSNSILQARVRDAQYHDLERRRRSSLLRGLMFIHLKEDLDSKPVDWIGRVDKDPPPEHSDHTSYGILKGIQQCLAGMRTDLDSFSDIEAYSLMTSAYRMTERAFNVSRCVEGFTDSKSETDWKFLQVEDAMQGEEPGYTYTAKMLGVSNRLAFKVWKLSSRLMSAAVIFGLILLSIAVWLVIRFAGSIVVPPINIPAISVGRIGITVIIVIATFLGVYLFGKRVMRALHWRDTLIRIVVSLIMCLGGFLIARLHLWFFDRLFLKLGSLATFESKK